MILSRKIKYKFGEEVALKVDPLTRRVVTGYTIRNKALTYILAGPEISESWHQDIEIEKVLTPQSKKAGVK